MSPSATSYVTSISNCATLIAIMLAFASPISVGALPLDAAVSAPSPTATPATNAPMQDLRHSGHGVGVPPFLFPYPNGFPRPTPAPYPIGIPARPYPPPPPPPGAVHWTTTTVVDKYTMRVPQSQPTGAPFGGMPVPPLWIGHGRLGFPAVVGNHKHVHDHSRPKIGIPMMVPYPPPPSPPAAPKAAPHPPKAAPPPPPKPAPPKPAPPKAPAPPAPKPSPPKAAPPKAPAKPPAAPPKSPALAPPKPIVPAPKAPAPKAHVGDATDATPEDATTIGGQASSDSEGALDQ